MNCDNEVHNEFLMGNEAIALGALHNGVTFASGYPGTPSTEILETIRMIEQQHLDIRTITMGISLTDCADGDVDTL